MSVQRKPGAPAVGFNHNLTYRGRVFHVQTEDSGPQHGHILTHVFLGGNILASSRSTYADLVAAYPAAELAAMVRRRMEEQHKAVLKTLLSGGYDAELARRGGTAAVYEPGVLASGERAPGLLVGGTAEEPPAARAPGGPAGVPAAAPVPGPAAGPAKSGGAIPAKSLFEENPGGERRLDELILSFLAADLDKARDRER